MREIDVTFDARKIGSQENPIVVSLAVVHVPFGEREQIRFNLRTVGSKSAAAFDLVPAFFGLNAPVRFAEPVPVGSTSFCLVDDNWNHGPAARRLVCTLWVRYEGQCYPALYPTIVNEPAAVLACAA
jgi:hypothetical protein